MDETPAEIAFLDALIAGSHRRATSHLRAIVNDGHRMDATDVVAALTGMRVLTLATVTARDEPRISAVDGHLLHGRWTFGTDGRSAKARHLEARPAVSAAYVDGERLGVFCHGTAIRLTPDDPGWDATISHWTRHYGTDPTTWGADVRMYRIEPTWLVGYRGAVPESVGG